MKKIIISDFDDTLYINKRIRKEDLNSIKEFRKKGNLFVIATGSSYESFKEKTKNINVEYDYLIVNHGSTVYKNDKIIFNEIIDRNVLDEIIRQYKLDNKDNYKVSGNSKKSFFSTAERGMVEPTENNITKVNIVLGEDNYNKKANDLKKTYSKYLNIYEINYDNSIEMISKKSSKLIAIDIIIKKEKIKKQNIYAIGDGNSDIEMIEKYNGYAMTNCVPKLKEISIKQVSSVDELINDIKDKNFKDINRNYNSLLLMRILKQIISIFTESFLVLYFMQLSNNNIIPFGIYNLFLFSSLLVTILLVRNTLKTKNRVHIFRMGIVFNFIFFLLILILNKNMIKYSPLLGIIYGIEEGLYFSVCNLYESNIPKYKLSKYLGTYTAVNYAMSVIIPLIFGSIMSFSGFKYCTVIILILVLMQLILTLIYKDYGNNSKEKIKLSTYTNKIKSNKLFIGGHNVSFVNGLTYSGAFASLITIYIIKVFKTGFSLGIITSILSVLTAIAGFIFGHYIKEKQYKNIIIIGHTLTIISLFIMMIKCNPITIILFSFIQTFAKPYTNLINTSNILQVSNNKDIKEEHKEEYFTIHEIALYVGRTIGYIVFCLLAFANNNFKTNIIMFIFIIFLLLRLIYSVKLQKDIDSKNRS